MKSDRGASPQDHASQGPGKTLCMLALAALLIMSSAGCSTSSPEKAVREFIGARAAGNDRAAAKLTVEGKLGDFPGGEPYLGGSGVSLQVGPVSMENDHATVMMIFSWDDQVVEIPYVVRREGSRWRVSLEETEELWLPAVEIEGPSSGS